MNEIFIPCGYHFTEKQVADAVSYVRAKRLRRMMKNQKLKHLKGALISIGPTGTLTISLSVSWTSATTTTTRSRNLIYLKSVLTSQCRISH